MRTAFLLYLVCDLLILTKSTDVVSAKITNSTSISNNTVPQKEQKQHVDGTTHKSVQQVSNYVGNDEPLSFPQNGALLRGFYVLCGFSALMLMYFMVKSYRLRHGSQPPAMVKRYGVRAHRSDLEMRRLELEEEEDDNTLFDINSAAH